MANIIFQPGDRVVVVAGYFHHGGVLSEHVREQVQAGKVLTIVRQMPDEPDHYETSPDGLIHRGSELHLVERASEAPTSDDAA